MLAKAHKSLIKVSCRAEILKHSQSNPSREVELALMSHLRECDKVLHARFLQRHSGCNFSLSFSTPSATACGLSSNRRLKLLPKRLVCSSPPFKSSSARTTATCSARTTSPPAYKYCNDLGRYGPNAIPEIGPMRIRQHRCLQKSNRQPVTPGSGIGAVSRMREASCGWC